MPTSAAGSWSEGDGECEGRGWNGNGNGNGSGSGTGNGNGRFEQPFMFHIIRNFLLLLLVAAAVEFAIR